MGGQKYRVCSEVCRYEIGRQLHVVGICEWDGKEIRGPKYKMGKQKHCNETCKALHEAEPTLGPTGPFRPTIEEYLAVNEYGKNSLPNVKVSLCHFFGFAVNEGATEIDQCKPRMIKRFFAAERARGMTTGGALGRLSTFFDELVEDEVIEVSPVIRGRHSKNWVPRTRQPYEENEMLVLCKAIEESDDPLLKAAFA